MTNNRASRFVVLLVAFVMTTLGVAALVGSQFDQNFVRDQLIAQKIQFGPAETLPDQFKQYAGAQVDSGSMAKEYAGLIQVHVYTATGGKSYSEVSKAAAEAAKGSDKAEAAKMADLKRTALDGQLLRGTLLNAYGWSLVGTIAAVAGFALLAVSAVLFVLSIVLVLQAPVRE